MRKTTLIQTALLTLISILIAFVQSLGIAENVPKTDFTIPSQTVNQATASARVIKIIDGDTIEIEGGYTVRYIGIDTPETRHPQKSIQCFGKEASDKNKDVVLGKMIKLEKDISETDRYGRLLRYVYVDTLFINDYLVRQGYAQAISYPPDIKYQVRLREAEKEARENNRGFWGICPLLGQ